MAQGSNTIEVLAGILQRALEAAGIPDEDPELLPERISELRFSGPVPVFQYPRRDKLRAEKAGRKGRQGIGYLGSV